jgi:hypothetical protein
MVRNDIAAMSLIPRAIKFLASRSGLIINSKTIPKRMDTAPLIKEAIAIFLKGNSSLLL